MKKNRLANPFALLKRFVRDLPKPRVDVALSGGLHWFCRHAFEKAGYEWEVRRTGDVAIGMWKISFAGSSKAKRKALEVPRRFVLIPGFGDSPLSWLTILLVIRSALRKKFDEV